MCEALNLGRTPLREELSQLQIEGYLELTPNKGLIITKLSAQNVNEIYQIIAVLEGFAVEIATRNFKKDDQNKIRLVHRDLEKACNLNDKRMWMEKNVIFHEYLVRASGNEFLTSLINSLRNRIYRYRFIALTMSDPLRLSHSAHKEVLKYVFMKDGKMASRAMQSHVLAVAENLMNVLSRYPEV